MNIVSAFIIPNGIIKIPNKHVELESSILYIFLLDDILN